MEPQRHPARAAALLLTALALGACGAPAAAGHQGMDMPAASAPASPSAAPVATNAVQIANFAFGPAAITVRAGTTVTWTNKDEDAHTVAITGAAVSKPLQNGDTYTYTFAQAGTYPYICTIHPNMHGMVVVTAG
jgi:plastocyanin